MGGGKSKSSSSTSQSQVTQDGTVVGSGKVFNVSGSGGVSVNYTDEFSANVKDIMAQLINLTGDVIDGAGNLVEGALETTVEEINRSSTAALDAAQQAAQPDLELLKSNTKYIPYLLGGVLLLAGVALWRK